MKFPKLKTLKRVLALIYKTRTIQAVTRDVVFVCAVFLEMYLINLGGRFIDATGEVLLNLDRFTLASYIHSDSFFFLFLGLGVWLVINGFNRLRDYLAEEIQRDIQFEMETRYFDKVSKENMEDVETKEFRNLLSYVGNYSFNGIHLTYQLFTEIIQDVARMVASMAVLIVHVGPLSLLLLLFVIPEAVSGYFHREGIRKYQNGQLERTKWIEYVTNLMTRIQYFPELRVDGTFKKLKEEYGKKAGVFLLAMKEKNKHWYIDTTFFATIGRVLLILYVVLVIAIAVAKRYSIGTFAALYNYAITAYESAYSGLNKIFQISNNLDHAQQYFDYIDFEGFGEREYGENALEKGVPEIKITNLDFAYPNQEKKVIENINLHILPGENVIIVGGDGSGKSTLIKLLCGLYKITAGDYSIGGYSIQELARGELKRKISVLFQDFVNYNMTLKQNILLGSEKTYFKEALYEKALQVSGVKRLMKIFKVEENQMLGKYVSNGIEISPGFWQRIAIARVMYRNREILILDEPFTYIDDKEEAQMLKDMFEFGKEKTIIYISREKRNTSMFDKAFVLEDGKLKKI